MQINMSELFSVDGKEQSYQVPVEMKAFSWMGRSYPVTEAKPVELTLVHVKNRNVKITGMIDLHMEIPCDRCLEPVDVPFVLKLEKEVDTNQTEEERQRELDDQPYVSGYYLDVDRMVCDELIVNMPMKILCREDCKGVCNRCGANLNYGSCTCDVTELDPRMSVIRDIFRDSNQKKEV